MNAVPIVDADQQDESMERPGNRLRQARLSRGLELSRVAAQMHLSDAIIEAIERDDYESLPGPVFVRGYLKNYARLLGMDTDRILDDYTRLLPADGGAPPLAHGARIKSEMGSGHPLLRLVTWLIVIALAALVVIWWQGRLTWPLEFSLPERTQPDKASSEDAGQGEGGRTQAPTETVPPLTEGSRYLEPAMTPRAETQPINPAASSVPPAEQAVVPGGAQTQEGGAAPTAEAGAEVAIAEAPEPTNAALEQAVVMQSEPVSGAGAQASVEFRFSGSSWLDVRDATEKNKIIGVMPKGSRRTLTGEPPFSVVLGNSRRVEVRVNGRPFDVSRFTRGNVARFQIEPMNPGQ